MLPLPRPTTPEYDSFLKSQITELTVAKYTPDEIVKKLREEKFLVSKVKITKVLEELKASWQERATTNIEAIVSEELATLDALQGKLWPMAISGAGQVIDRVIHIMEHRAKLLGLYAPTQRKITVEGTVIKAYMDLDIEKI